MLYIVHKHTHTAPFAGKIDKNQLNAIMHTALVFTYIYIQIMKFSKLFE